jgi:hypothetical protein
MLKIIPASEPLHVVTLCICLYGSPGIGKTSLASSAESPLLLDFDQGAHRSKFRCDTVSISNWADVDSMKPEDLKPYKTILIDTAGRCLDMLIANIIAKDEKMGKNGTPSLKGWGELKDRFRAWLKYLRSLNLDVIFIAHSDERQVGDVITERIDMQGSSKGEVYKQADLMGKLYFEGGSRRISFDPSDASFGKNPSQLPKQEIPNLLEQPKFLASLIQQTKDGINVRAKANAEQVDVLEAWRRILDAISTAQEFNEWLPKAAETKNKAVSALMSAAAKKHGLKFDKKTGLFSAAAVAA